MKELRHASFIHFKGGLLLVLGLLAFVVLVVRNPNAVDAALVAVCIWAFARFYYYAFYVIEHYVDGRFRFSGLAAFAFYLAGWSSEPEIERRDGGEERR